MTTIKEILDSLEKEQHQQLMHAFNNGLSDHIEYSPGNFIGVNIDSGLYQKFQITDVRGKWSIGIILENKSETS